MTESLYFDEEEINLDVFTSASLGYENCLDFLSGNQDVNATNSSCWTGLMYASYYGHLCVVEKLVENGADVEMRNKNGRTALVLASMCGKDDVCRFLLQFGAKLEAKDKKDWNSLFYATYFNQHSAVKLFLDFGADPNETESETHMTPFLLSAFYGHELIFRYFLENKGNLMSKLNTGESIEDLARKQNHARILELYRSREKGENRLERIDTGVCFKNLGSLLGHLGLEKYLSTFEAQDVDLQMFLTLSDHDLREIGITRIGPRRKMTAAISRWHSNKLNKSLLSERKLEKIGEKIEDEKIFIRDLMKLCADVDKCLLKVKKKLPKDDDVMNELVDCFDKLNTKVNTRVAQIESIK